MMKKNVSLNFSGGLRGGLSFGRMIGITAASGALLFALAGTAQAATSAAAQAEATYKADVARCNSGKSGQDRSACLREASAARAEATRGTLQTKGQETYDRNRLARCQGLPADQRDDCVGRMTRGTSTGTVEGGGVLREYRRTVPATPAK
jgi:hypothetical protein